MADKTPFLPVIGSTGAGHKGRPFGKYVLFEELGRGGMGVVYRALDPELDRVVAIKMLIGADAASQEEVVRLQREAKAAAKLRHPNIIGIYHVGVQDGRSFFAMEFVKGKTLDELAANLPERKLLEYIRDVARALHYAHGQSIVHRDVKPSNILISDDGKAFLMDFGLAKQLKEKQNLTATGFVMGTPNFMSPEQVNGLSDLVDGRSDVFSLGSVLYAMLTGKCPFERDSVLKTVVAVVQNPAEPPRKLKPSLSVDAETICMKALEKDRSQRYASAAVMAEDIDRYLKGEMILARPVSRVTKSMRWTRRNPLPVAFVALVTVSVFGVTLLYLAYRAKQAEGERIKEEARLRQEREEEAQRKRDRVEQFVRDGREKMTFAEKCMMGGQGDALGRSLGEAIRFFDQALAEDEGRTVAWLERGRARSLRGEKAKALEDFGKALALQGDLAMAHYERGKVWLARCIDAMTIARMEPPLQTPSVNAREAREAQQQASEAFARAAALDPGPGNEYLLAHARGALAFLKGDVPVALAELEKAIAANQVLDDALGLRAFLRLVDAHDPVKARADLDLAIQVNKFNLFALALRGVVRAEQGELTQAQEDYERALRIDPTLWRAHLNRGRARIAAKDFVGAVDDLGAVLTAQPDNLLALQDRAEARIGGRDWPGAEADLTRALSLAPGAAPLHARRAAVRRQAGENLAGALEDADLAAHDPSSRREGLLERALVKEAMGNVDGAVADYGEVLAVDDRCAEAYVGRGELYRKQGRAAEAAADFKGFLERFPDDPQAPAIRAALAEVTRPGK
ncbi:MAG: protein kinase [Planctomycetes bacterium]|nr:protein kinase [Planctomycetota bacterium]